LVLSSTIPYQNPSCGIEICVCSFRKGVSPLNETQCRYIEKLPTAWTQEDVEPEPELELEKFFKSMPRTWTWEVDRKLLDSDGTLEVKTRFQHTRYSAFQDLTRLSKLGT
jgi:hypothetical protein